MNLPFDIYGFVFFFFFVSFCRGDPCGRPENNNGTPSNVGAGRVPARKNHEIHMDTTGDRKGSPYMVSTILETGTIKYS